MMKVCDLFASQQLVVHRKLNLFWAGFPILHKYGAAGIDSATYIPVLCMDLFAPIAKRDQVYSSNGQTKVIDNKSMQHKSTIQPFMHTDKINAMHKILDKDWSADLGFDESERAELLLLLPHCENTKDRFPIIRLRLASCKVLPKLATSAAKLIRACLHRPTANHGASITGNYKPRSTGSASCATRSAIDSSPVEDIASIERTPGLADPPCTRPSLLTKAFRSTSLLATTARRAASRLPEKAAAFLRAFHRPRLDDGSPSPASEKGHVDRRPTMESGILMCNDRHGAAARW